MKTTLEKINSVKQCLTVEVPAEEQDRARKMIMDGIRKEAKVPGFRKGKVPDAIILQRFGKQMEVDVIKEMVRQTYPKAIGEVNARPLADPRIEPQGELKPGEPFTYKAFFEIYPEVTAAGYDKLALEREEVAVTGEEVEAELRRLQRQMTQLEPAPEGEIGPGMVGMIDFKGTAAGKPFAGSEAEDYVVDFGSGTLLKDFEVQIEGMRAKEEREVVFHYPEDYFKKELAGKKGKFKVKAKEVRRKIVPDMDDEFAKELGNYKNLADVRADLKRRLAEYKEILARNAMKEQAVRHLIEKHKDLKVPMALVDAELGNMLEQLRRRLTAAGKTLEDAKVDAKEFVRSNVDEATNRARGYMVVSAIARQEGIDVADDEINNKIKEIAAAGRQPEAKVREHFDKENLWGHLRSQILFDKTLDFVLNKSKIKVKKAKKAKK